MLGPSGDPAGRGRDDVRTAAAGPTAPWESGTRPSPPWSDSRGTGSTPPSNGPVPLGEPAQKPERKGSLGVALLLAAAAVAAAIVGVRVSSVSGEASGHWQSAVRLEVKRSTSAQETVRYLYNTEVPLAITIIRARLVLQVLDQIPATMGPEYTAVAIEKSVQTEILKALEPSSDLTKPAYALADGGVDLGKRLTDLRAGTPDDLKIDPDATQVPGDALSGKVVRMSLVLVLFGVCGLLGALAQTFAPLRRRLLQAGTSVLAAGVFLAAVVEVLQ
jgi:hypothetical protein